jgi:hypothetical protein
VDNETKLTLHGLQQFFVNLAENEKNRKLNDLLDALLFNQVIIFVKTVARAVALNKLLGDCNFPSISIHRDLNQEERYRRSRIGLFLLELPDINRLRSLIIESWLPLIFLEEELILIESILLSIMICLTIQTLISTE